MKKFITSFMCAFTIFAAISASTVFAQEQQQPTDNNVIATSTICSPIDPVNW